MSKYSVDIHHEEGVWTAVLPDLMIVGNGTDAPSAVADALRKAQETEEGLVRAGVADLRRDGSLRIAAHNGRRVYDLLVEYGIRALFISLVLAGLYLMVRGDLRDQADHFRDRLFNELSLGDASSEDDTARSERLQVQARKLNKQLMPAARELRPLVRALLGDDSPSVSEQEAPARSQPGN